LASPEGTLAYEREAAGDRRAVIINFTDEAVRAPLEESWRVEVASDGVGEGKPFAGIVAPSTGLLLGPAGSHVS
jgi:alpha-glucosidase